MGLVLDGGLHAGGVRYRAPYGANIDSHIFLIDILKLTRCVQNQKASQAQSNSKQEQITTQVSTENSLPLLTEMIQRRKRKNFVGIYNITGGIYRGNGESIRFRIEEALRGEQDGEGQGRNGQETDQRIFP